MCVYNHEELATVLVLVLARVAQVTSVTLSLLARFHLVLMAFLLLRRRKNSTSKQCESAHSGHFQLLLMKRCIAKTQALDTRLELELIV